MDTGDPHFNAQIHAWVEEYYKHTRQKQWLQNAVCEPVDLRHSPISPDFADFTRFRKFSDCLF
jgi:hypothetical protein